MNIDADTRRVIYENGIRFGRIEALKEAMKNVGSLAERPYDNEPEFTAILAAERQIKLLLDEAIK